MIKITYDQKVYEFPENTDLQTITQAIAPKGRRIVAATLNNVMKNLNATITEDADIDFVDTTSLDGYNIMLRTATLVFLMAARKVCGKHLVSVEYRMNKALYVRFYDNAPMKYEVIEKISEEMKKIIAADFILKKQSLPKNIARKLFEEEGYFDKIRLYDTLDFEEIDLYEVDNHIYTFHGYLAPSTGYVQKFEVTSYYPGAMIMIPARDCEDQVTPFREEKTLAKIFSNSQKWTELLDLGFVASLNERIQQENTDYLINVNEAYFENQVSEIAKRIVSDTDINLVLISGPSSSGKTTLSQRLSVQLGTHGKNCIAIHMDDYFVNREDTPLDENGERDYETIEAVDLQLFNDHLMSLIEGEEIELPSFDFYEGVRKMSGKKIHLKENSILVIEGIHGLNPKLTQKIPDKNKFKIYVSALTQLNIDCHNRISTTDMRLLRRIVRDHEFRGKSVQDTLHEWPKVRRGEKNYIFPYQDLADAAIDSSLVYEVSVLKKHIFELFQNFDRTNKYYKDVHRLMAFLKYFHSIDDDDKVPGNSILREFINKKNSKRSS